MTDWRDEPTVSFEAITLTDLPPVTGHPRGRHRAPQEPRPGVEAGTRWTAYTAAAVGVLVAAIVVVWGVSSGGDESQQLTPLGRVTPGPLTTVPFPPPATSTPDVPLAVDSGTYTALPRVRTFVRQQPRVTTRRVIPAPVVTTTVPVPATSATEPTSEPAPSTPETTPETSTGAPEDVPQQRNRGHRWRHGQAPTTDATTDNAPSALLGIIGR